MVPGTGHQKIHLQTIYKRYIYIRKYIYIYRFIYIRLFWNILRSHFSCIRGFEFKYVQTILAWIHLKQSTADLSVNWSFDLETALGENISKQVRWQRDIAQIWACSSGATFPCMTAHLDRKALCYDRINHPMKHRSGDLGNQYELIVISQPWSNIWSKTRRRNEASNTWWQRSSFGWPIKKDSDHPRCVSNSLRKKMNKRMPTNLYPISLTCQTPSICQAP